MILRDEQTGEFLARLPFMPWCVGVGHTPEIAIDCLSNVVRAWIEHFTEANGFALLAERLMYEKEPPDGRRD